MENEYLQMLAQIVLPTQILDYFTIAGVGQTESEIHISLDEKMHPELSGGVHFESKASWRRSVSQTSYKRPQGNSSDSTQALDRYPYGQEFQPTDRS